MALDFVAGCLGGSAGVLVGHPLDTVKVCLQTQDYQNPKYQSTMDCLQTIFKNEGFKGLYKGVRSPLLGVAGINAIVFGVYGNTQRCMTNPESLKSHAIAGALAGLVQSFVCSPMELAKSIMQVGGATTDSPLKCLKSIYNQSGLRGVYRGLNITILREIPAFSSYFLTYEFITRRNDNLPVSTISMLIGGGTAGVLSWILIYPIDVIKTRFQTDSLTSNKYLNAYDCFMKSVKVEGYSCLFRGICPTLIRAFPVNAVTFTVVTWTMKIFDLVDHAEPVFKRETILRKYADTIAMSSVDQTLIGIL